MISQKTKIRIIQEKLYYFDSHTKTCMLCPRECGFNRMHQKGYCRSGLEPYVYSYGPHHGEEPPVSGTNGSGTVFFSNCTLSCVYCQNYKFSQEGSGKRVEKNELSEIFIELQRIGCHNINLVSPAHYLPCILRALLLAYKNGLTIPIVYNTSGYESAPVIEHLSGIIDIYLTDMRYANNDMAKKYSDAADYVEQNQTAVREMFRQVGNLKYGVGNVAEKGLIIRCLIMPGNISGTRNTLDTITKCISPDAFVSLMSQYYPAFKAKDYPELSRKLTISEYNEIKSYMHKINLKNGWAQELPDELESDLIGENLKPIVG